MVDIDEGVVLRLSQLHLVVVETAEQLMWNILADVLSPEFRFVSPTQSEAVLVVVETAEVEGTEQLMWNILADVLPPEFHFVSPTQSEAVLIASTTHPW